MAELNLLRTFSGFVPATPADFEKTIRVKVGDIIQCKYSKVRNPRFHRKFFAMLNLGFEYWTPANQLLSTLATIRKHLDTLGMEPSAATAFVEDFAHKNRADFETYTHKDFETYRAWALVEAGYYRVATSPAGLVKVPLSISFSSMDEDVFNDLYKAVFDVIWVHLKDCFPNRAEAERAAEQLFQFA